MATCSLPSLQWIPSSDDIMCVQPQGRHCERAGVSQVKLSYMYGWSLHGDIGLCIKFNASSAEETVIPTPSVVVQSPTNKHSTEDYQWLS